MSAEESRKAGEIKKNKNKGRGREKGIAHCCAFGSSTSSGP